MLLWYHSLGRTFKAAVPPGLWFPGYATIVGMEKIKVTFNLPERTKERLEALKAKLRKAGVTRAVANESAIVDALILSADFDDLLEAFERQCRDVSRRSNHPR